MDYPKGRELVNTIIQEYLQNVRYDPRIRIGMEYVLSGGKRLRPIITLAILEKLLPDTWNDFQQICLVPEFIHSSSLVIDDLPAFDDAKFRRGQQCVHIAKGEGLAYLLSFNLVTEAVLIVHRHLSHLKEHYPTEEAYRQYEAQIQNVITNISGERALGGQLLSTFHTSGDINLRDMNMAKPPKLNREEICDILYKKTSSFFEISLILGWIVGQGDLDRLDDIKALSKVLGLCYQIYDDFLDYHEDVSNSDHFSHNYVYHRGPETAYYDFLAYSGQMAVQITRLGLDCPIFDYIQKFMYERIVIAKAKIAPCRDST